MVVTRIRIDKVTQRVPSAADRADRSLTRR